MNHYPKNCFRFVSRHIAFQLVFIFVSHVFRYDFFKTIASMAPSSRARTKSSHLFSGLLSLSSRPLSRPALSIFGRLNYTINLQLRGGNKEEYLFFILDKTLIIFTLKRKIVARSYRSSYNKICFLRFH